MKLCKSYPLTITLLTLSLWTAGCSSSTQDASGSIAKPQASSSQKTTNTEESGAIDPLVSLPFHHPDMVDPKLVKECEDYISLTESYLEGSSFEFIDSQAAETISQLLSGHYEVIGRRDKNGREYYLALRRTDAPSYEDFYSLSMGYIDIDLFQMGYYNEAMDETILYNITDFYVETFMERQGEDVLDMFCLIPRSLSDDAAFTCAFDESGRLQLDFMKKHTGLSFHKDGQPCIDFYYQDEDTLQFWSEPYSCCIPLDEEDCSRLISLFNSSENSNNVETSFETHGQVLDYVRTLDSSIRTTGASFTLEDTVYDLLGSQNSDGYLMSYHQSDFGKTDIALEYNQPVFSYIISKIKQTTGQDYGNFTDTWFELPLVSASLDFPRLESDDDGSFSLKTESQTVTEPEKLTQLSRLLSEAIHGHEALSGCPYTGVLILTREDGETLRMFVATDSCDSVTYEGRIGFEYGNQKKLSDIFDKAIPSWE